MMLLNLLSFLPRLRPLAKVSAVLPAGPHTAVLSAANPPVHGEDPPLHGCGWFDSSHDLHHGLCVQEHSHTDSLARELPLVNWLELQLSGWCAPQAA